MDLKQKKKKEKKKANNEKNGKKQNEMKSPLHLKTEWNKRE